MDATGEADDLWEGLNLGGLLNDLARENESALAQAKKLQAKRVSESESNNVFPSSFKVRFLTLIL